MSASQIIRQSENLGEIDLLELFQSLWQQKLLILLSTVAVAAAALIYALQSPLMYQTKASLLPPRLSDIAPYNLGRTESLMVEFKVADVYAVFTRSLSSESLRRDFFNQVFIPSLSEGERDMPRDILWARYSKALTALAPEPKLRPDNFEVRVESTDPEQAAEWVNLYVKMAADKANKNMQSNVLSEISTRVRAVERRIGVLRKTALQVREDRMARLREALQIANELGASAPQVIAGKLGPSAPQIIANELGASAPQMMAGKTYTDSELSAFVDGDLMYMRGSKAISAELKALAERKSDDPFIEELRDLRVQLAFLKGIDVDPENVAVFTLDRAAEVPQTPTNPRKIFFLAAGILIGAILGVFMALIRGLVRKYQAATSGAV